MRSSPRAPVSFHCAATFRRSLVIVSHRSIPASLARREKDFRFFTLDEGRSSHSYSPLTWGSPRALRDRLIAGCIFSHERFYRNAARAASERILRALLSSGQPVTFQKIFAALSSPDAMAKLAQGANPEDRTIMLGNVEEWRKFSQETSGLIDNVAEFSSQELASRLCLAEPDITLPKIDRQGLVAHFELSSLLFREGAPSLARMLIEEIKAYAGDLARRGNTSPLHVYIDEAGKAVYDGFLELITECRSTGLTITLSTQSPLDFRTSEADVLQAVIQNTATKLFLQQADDESADKCARLTTLTAGQRTS